MKIPHSSTHKCYFEELCLCNHLRKVYHSHNPHQSITPALAAQRTALKPLPELSVLPSKHNMSCSAWAIRCHCKKSNKHPPVPHMETRLPQRYGNPTGQCAVSSQNILPAPHQQFLISSFSKILQIPQFQRGWKGCSSLHHPKSLSPSESPISRHDQVMVKATYSHPLF